MFPEIKKKLKLSAKFLFFQISQKSQTNSEIQIMGPKKNILSLNDTNMWPSLSTGAKQHVSKQQRWKAQEAAKWQSFTSSSFDSESQGDHIKNEKIFVDCTRCGITYRLHRTDLKTYHQSKVVKPKEGNPKYGCCLLCRLTCSLEKQRVPAQCKDCDKFYWLMSHHFYWEEVKERFKRTHQLDWFHQCPCCWHKTTNEKRLRAEPMKEAWALAACRQIKWNPDDYKPKE